MSTNATTEFVVDLTCQSCVKSTETVLKTAGIENFTIDLAKQRVVVTSDRPVSEIQSVIESTGKRAILVGSGGLAAVAMLGGQVGAGIVQGVIRFVQVDPSNCVIDGTVDGLTPGEHGLAIHECGDLSNGCESIGDHYNPRMRRHGSPVDGEDQRHVGDLGNIVAGPDGRATFRLSDKLVRVSDIIGRSVAVSADRDDLGLGNSPLSKINGNCGKLLTCGIIARASGLFENSKRFCACDGVTIWDERDKPIAGPGRSSKPNL